MLMLCSLVVGNEYPYNFAYRFQRDLSFYLLSFVALGIKFSQRNSIETWKKNHSEVTVEVHPIFLDHQLRCHLTELNTTCLIMSKTLLAMLNINIVEPNEGCYIFIPHP